MMTEQIQEKKKPKKNKEIKATLNKTFKDPKTLLKTVDKTILAIDEKYLEEFKEVKETVKSIIIRWAEELEEKIGMHPNNISTHITHAVEKDGFCHPSYVRKCLAEKYKNLSMADNARAGDTSSANTKEEIPCPHCHLKPSEDPKSDSDIIWEMLPEEYNHDDLDAYNRNYLIEIVRYKEKVEVELNKRIKALEAELKA